MSQHTQFELLNPGLLAGYQTPNDVYDELARGQIPPHWQAIIGYFDQAANDARTPQPEQIRAEMLVRDIDVQRPWRLDPIPFVIADDDWRALEAGLVQRARLLNALVTDLYGPRALLNPDGLPPALVFGNPRFLLPAFDHNSQQAQPLQVLAFDIGRSPDGQWRVLADWTEAPEGLGICLENRMISRQAVPDLFNSLGIERLADFFAAFAQQLAMLNNQVRPDSISVMLSSGPDHPNYFEHTYLGQYFGFPVVEGADLTVRGSGLLLKTLEGLKPVGSVLRMPHSADCDNLYLNHHSSDGVAGLTNISRHGQVVLANALGAGVVENDAFMSFLPGLCEELLGETLKLPSLASWWCGQPQELDYVLQQHSELCVGSAFTRPNLVASDLQHYQQSGEHVDEARIQLEPHGYVGRELIKLSHAPFVDANGTLSSGPSMLRLFVGATEHGYQLMPGGIARVGTAEGEISKDIWVHSRATTPIPTVQRASPISSRRSDRDLPSRTADDLFWLGRYLERCEGSVRAYRCLFTHVAEGGLEDQQLTATTIVNLLVNLDMITPAQARQLIQPTQMPNPQGPVLTRQWWSTLFNTSSSDGLIRLLQHINRLANQVRERLSGDAWRMFNALAQTTSEHWMLHSVGDALGLMDRIIERLSALNGQIQENMTRGYGWRLLELGRRLERGQFGLQVIGEIVTQPSYSDSQMYLLLDLCDSIITYRARYQNAPALENVLHLLLLDETNPRAMVYQITRMQQLMNEMPQDQRSEGLSDSQRTLLSAYHELLLAEPAKLANVVSTAGNRTQLRRVLKRLEATLANLSELVTATYFAHSQSPGMR